MIKLILIRAAPLFFRPAAIVLEGAFIGREGVLTLALPTAMMALAISSVPVHLSYFKRMNEQGTGLLAREYVAALTWVTILGFVLLFSALRILSLATGAVAWIICFIFLCEKISDEISRKFEFQRQFGKWFFMQGLRSIWLIFPVAFFLFGFDYQRSFLISAVAMSSLMVLLFFLIAGLRPSLGFRGLPLIFKNTMYLASGLLTASYRQLPRIFVAKVFPEQAHLYLAMAQVGQGAALLFNVRYQIPYRKLIARHAPMFQKILRPQMAVITGVILTVALGYIYGEISEKISHLGEIGFVAALIPIVISEALGLAIVSAYLGYLPWFAKRLVALTTYILCMAFAFILCGALYYLKVFNEASILQVPAFMTVLGALWTLIIVKRHFVLR